MSKNRSNLNIRAREPITRSRGIVRGQFPSYKMNRMIAWESQLERRACYLFEFSSGVKSFREQPTTFKVPFYDRVRRYTPDFELILAMGEIVYVEIKPANKLEDKEVLVFYNNISIQLNRQGYQFIVITDNELKNPIQEKNLVILRSFQQQILSDFEMQQTLNWLANREKPTYFKELISYLNSSRKAYALIAKGIVSVNLNQPISEEISICLKEDHHESYLFICRTAPDFRPRQLSDYTNYRR